MQKKSFLTRGKHRYATLVGAIFIIFAIIGIITVTVFTFNLTGRIFDNSSQKEEFESFLLPVVMLDPPPFEKPENLDELFLLQSSMWSTLLTKDRSAYAKDDFGYLLVPSSDIEASALALYGPDVKLNHQTFGDFEVSYLYDEELKVYHVPMVGQSATYTPKVTKIEEKGDYYVLTVGYVPPGNLWTQTVNGQMIEPEPTKYMQYNLKKYKGGYYLESMQDVQESSSPAQGIPVQQ